MPTHYSPRGFLRQVSNDLLRQYFEAKGCLLDVDWEALTETKIEPLYEAWLALPEAQQRIADADFTEINELANDAGIAVLIEEGEWHGLRLNEYLEQLDDQVDMVTWTLLRHPEVFKVGAFFLAADRIPARSWHRWKDLPARTPRDDRRACGQLEEVFSEHFLRTEGRGRHCTVEVYQRAGDYYYFAFPEDYARAEQDYVDGVLTRQTHRSSFQVVAVYSPERGTIDVSGPGGKRVVTKLMGLIVATILESDASVNMKDDRVYDLEPLRRRDMSWVFPTSAGISAVWVKSLRLTFKADRNRLVLEGDRDGAVHTLYSRLIGADGKPGRVAPEAVRVTQAVIRAEYADRDGRKVSPRDIRITWPNNCNLGQDQRDRVLREMLINSGIDPQKLGLDAER